MGYTICDRVTSREVAQRAGVSQATVSRVLNNSNAVREETRQRVLRAIRELGYTPDEVARSMVLRRTYTLGLVVADLSNPFYGETAKAIVNTARDLGYHVILGNTDNKALTQREYIRLLIKRRVDGIIFASVRRHDRDVAKLIKAGFPCIMYNRRLSQEYGHFIVLDNFRGAYEATTFLLGLGHRRIAFIAGPPQFSTAYERLKGYLAALKDYGIPADHDLVRQGMFDRSRARRQAKSLLSMKPPPTAIFAGNDIMALGALEAAVGLGLRVPEDVSIVGFDDIDMASHETIQLTTVTQKKYEMGALAVRKLVDIIEGRVVKGEWVQIVLEPALLIRRTTAPPPSVPAAVSYLRSFQDQDRAPEGRGSSL